MIPKVLVMSIDTLYVESEEPASISHQDALITTCNILGELLKDPVLKDIPLDVTSSELKAKIDLEQGCAFLVNLKRETDNGFEYIQLIAKQKTTVGELKLHIQRSMSRKVQAEGGTKCISWKYFWKTYWLVHNNEKLSDNKKIMKDHGIKHGSEISFLKRLRRK